MLDLQRIASIASATEQADPGHLTLVSLLDAFSIYSSNL